jgi:hypothetical protein
MLLGLFSCIYRSYIYVYFDGFVQSINLWNQKTPLLVNKHILDAVNNRRVSISIKIEECHHFQQRLR